MSKEQITWNKIFKEIPIKTPKTDDWLEKYLSVIDKSRNYPIIDLGCGFGNDTYYLIQKGFKVISCDFSQEALNRLTHFIEKPDTKLIDMRDPLPFEDSSIVVIVCDLSLHYFDEKTTFSVIKEIKRVLINGGALICRVNSTEELKKDFIRTKIAENFYAVGGKNKRYFSESDVKKFFADFSVGKIYSYIMPRYRFDKHVLDFCCVK